MNLGPKLSALLAVGILAGAATARADAVFNFDAYAVETPTTNTAAFAEPINTATGLTVASPSGLTATYIDGAAAAGGTASCDPNAGECGYLIRDPNELDAGTTHPRFGFTFNTDYVALGFGHDPLDINFSSAVSSFSAPFALRFDDTGLIVSFYLNGTEVYSNLYAETGVPSGLEIDGISPHEFEEGTIAYSGALFNEVVVQAPVTTYYPNGVGHPPTLNGPVSFTLGDVTVPEPSSLALFAVGVVPLLLRRRRAR